jgi:hypothetical protein
MARVRKELRPLTSLRPQRKPSQSGNRRLGAQPFEGAERQTLFLGNRSRAAGRLQGRGLESRLSLRESSATFAERTATVAGCERLLVVFSR